MFFNLFGKKEKKPEQSSADGLELARQKLIYDLETKGITFLLHQMKRKEVYSDLILERRKKGMGISSSDRISWYAYRQSEKLNSPADKKELLALLDDKADSSSKEHIYFCLSNLCSNTNDKELFRFLMDALSQEEEEDMRVAILSKLQSIVKEADLNIEPIKRLVTDGTADERKAAILALSNTSDPAVEDLLLDEFKMSDKHIKWMICAPLGTIGTTKSIPVLREEYKKTRDYALRSDIDQAIYKIEKRGCH